MKTALEIVQETARLEPFPGDETRVWTVVRALARVVCCLAVAGREDRRRTDQLERRVSALVKRQDRKGRAT